MNIIDFLKYFLDKHPLMFGLIAIILAMGISSMLSNLFYSKHRAKVNQEHERRFWK